MRVPLIVSTLVTLMLTISAYAGGANQNKPIAQFSNKQVKWTALAPHPSKSGIGIIIHYTGQDHRDSGLVEPPHRMVEWQEFKLSEPGKTGEMFAALKERGIKTPTLFPSSGSDGYNIQREPLIVGGKTVEPNYWANPHQTGY